MKTHPQLQLYKDWNREASEMEHLPEISGRWIDAGEHHDPFITPACLPPIKLIFPFILKDITYIEMCCTYNGPKPPQENYHFTWVDSGEPLAFEDWHRMPERLYNSFSGSLSKVIIQSIRMLCYGVSPRVWKHTSHLSIIFKIVEKNKPRAYRCHWNPRIVSFKEGKRKFGENVSSPQDLEYQEVETPQKKRSQAESPQIIIDSDTPEPLTPFAPNEEPEVPFFAAPEGLQGPTAVPKLPRPRVLDTPENKEVTNVKTPENELAVISEKLAETQTKLSNVNERQLLEEVKLSFVTKSLERSWKSNSAVQKEFVNSLDKFNSDINAIYETLTAVMEMQKELQASISELQETLKAKPSESKHMESLILCDKYETRRVHKVFLATKPSSPSERAHFKMKGTPDVELALKIEHDVAGNKRYYYDILSLEPGVATLSFKDTTYPIKFFQPEE